MQEGSWWTINIFMISKWFRDHFSICDDLKLLLDTIFYRKSLSHRTYLKQIPYRGYRLARNGNYELVAEWPAFFSEVYRSHVEIDLSSLRFPQDDKDRLNVTPHKALSSYSEVSGSFHCLRWLKATSRYDFLSKITRSDSLLVTSFTIVWKRPIFYGD